jgi:hypothetical protein
MKNYFLGLTALLIASVSTTAAPPSDQAIEQMMRVMQVEQMLNQMLTQTEAGMQTGMEQSLQQAMQGKTPTDAQKAQLVEFEKKLSGILKDELSFAKMKDVYLQVYRETFTQEEITSIIAFYSSPAGKALVEKVPVAMQKASSLMQARIGPMTQRLQAMIEQFQKEVEKTK